VYNPDEQDAYRQATVPYQYQPQPQQGYPPNRPQQQGFPPYGQQQQQWYPPHGQPVRTPGYAESNRETARPNMNRPSTRIPRPDIDRSPGEKLRTAPKAKHMPKAEALALVDKLKNWVVIGSVVAFGTIGGLVISHSVGVTSTQAANNNTQQSAPSSSSSSSSSQSGGFFQQQQQQGQGQGGNTFGSSSTSQPPVSSSSVS
jgi:hypothetical protein